MSACSATGVFIVLFGLLEVEVPVEIP